MKFEQNCSYIGGGDTKSLQSVAIIFNLIIGRISQLKFFMVQFNSVICEKKILECVNSILLWNILHTS